MVLFMARPFKHPTTGVYYFRKAVPADLKPVLGNSEVKQSLGTKDPAQARELFSAVAAQVAAEWKLLRAEPAALTRKQELALAGRWYLWFTAQHEQDPGDDAAGWRLLADQFEDARQVGIGAPDEPDDPSRPKGVQARVECFLARSARTADFLLSEGVALSAEGRTGFLRALEPQFFAALRLLSRWSEGDYRPDHHPEQFPPLRLEMPAAPTPESTVTLSSIFDGWAGERQPPEKTRYSWRRIVDQFQTHLGHEDALRVTKADVVAWKDALVAEGKSPKTVKDSKLAPVRAILQWAVDNDRLKENPAKDIKLATKQRGGGRRGFSDEEARMVLRAALADERPLYRWVPWLCALAGARISEICQLRGVDVLQQEGYWVLRLTWDAGELKNQGSERVIPVHSALVAMGFLDFAKARGAGALFVDVTPDRFGNRGGNATKVLGRWVRDALGLDDPRLGPNHSWRHRFKTHSRRHGIGKDFHDAITGHAHADEGDAYGEFPIDALAREIEKLPDPLAR